MHRTLAEVRDPPRNNNLWLLFGLAFGTRFMCCTRETLPKKAKNAQRPFFVIFGGVPKIGHSGGFSTPPGPGTGSPASGGVPRAPLPRPRNSFIFTFPRVSPAQSEKKRITGSPRPAALSASSDLRLRNTRGAGSHDSCAATYCVLPMNFLFQASSRAARDGRSLILLYFY